MMQHFTRVLGVVVVTGAVVLSAAAGFPRAGDRTDRPGAGTGVAGGDEFRVLRSDEKSVVIEYRPRFHPLQMIGGERGEQFTRQDFDGAVASTDRLRAGSPDLRYRNIPLGFPAEAGNTVQMLASDYEDVSGVLYAPLPSLRIRDKMLEAEPLAARAEQYSENRFLPTDIVQLSPVKRSRNFLVGAVRVFPLQYNPALRRLRKYTRVVIQVTFGRAEVRRTSDRREDRLYAGAFLNYDIARSWQLAPEGPMRGVVSSVLKSGDWYRIAVTDDGIYQLTPAYLGSVGVDLTGVDPRTIKIYGNGGMELSENVSQPRPVDLVENAIYVAGESDKTFDPGDYVLFYGASVRGWTYAPATRSFSHYLNHYTEVNYYWLTFGGAFGKRMQGQPSLPVSPALVPDRFIDHSAVEDERANILSSGKDWLGQSISPGGSFTYLNSLTGLVPNDNIQYRFSLVSQLGTNASMTVREGTTPIGSYFLGTATGNYLDATGGIFQVTGTTSLPGNQSQLSFAYTSFSETGTGWIDWIEISYPRDFTGSNDYLRFRSPDTTAVVEYQIKGFSPTTPTVLDVTLPQNPRMITGVSPTAVQGMYYFRAQETGGKVSEYCAAGPVSWKIPAGVEKAVNEDLRGYSDSTDFIIVTSQEFRSEADRLAQFRSQPEHGGLKTYVADMNQIYNEFAGGLPDATAMRDFLKYAYDNWNPRPQFVLFFGGASYDYKGILGFKSSFVPTWQSPESHDEVDSYSTDDFFTWFGAGNIPYLVSGRIACRTLAEADVVVNKIVRYETGSVQDSWKMRMLFVADDAWTSEQTSEVGDGFQHSQDQETLSSPSITPDELEKRKIYIAEYPTVYTAQGRRKPGAYQAIIDQINQGVLMVNYAGHGNPTVWAHERIFQVETSIPQLTNSNRLSVFVLATCNFSQFDDAKAYDGGELLMNKPDGGAVGLISATRKVYAAFNAALNQGMHRRMFTRDQFGRVVVERPATALFKYKAAGFVSENDQKFFYMGDPTMRLQYPAGYASIDSINGQRVDSVGGAPRSAPIPLKSLSTVTLAGTVRDSLNNLDPSYASGQTTIVVNDATRIATIVNFYPGAPPWNYVATGGTIYRGENSITSGRFRAMFIVPKDIAYADSTARGRLVAYYYDPNVIGRDGVAYTSSVRIAGADSTSISTGIGPQITIYLENDKFRAGDLVSENPLLIVELSDSVGINTSGSGIGHRIEAWLNNSTQSTDLTDYYSSKKDDFRSGEIQYRLQNVPQGKNTLRLRAWDSYNNPATAQTQFTVTSSDQLTITDVMNYPNPFAGSTSFTLRQNQTAPVSIVIKIYTVAGRLIQSIDATTNGESFVRIFWDGRDRDGDILANGVYLYKVIARTLDGRFSSEALGKLTVLK
jgi:hypothetical protein